MAILKPSAAMTPTWTFFEGEWQSGNVAIMGSRTHAAWLGSMVFDGARAFEGVTPDLGLHCQRVNASAASFFLQPVVPVERWLDLAHEGIKRFPPKSELYIRPMYWAEDGAAGGGVRFDPGSTRWCLCIYEAALPVPTGTAITLSPYRRPTRETAPVEAKAGCLYPNNSHALIEAYRRGFGNCLLRDMLGNIAELANSNVFLASDGVVYTPASNGTFLSGITRNRVIGLLAKAGVPVVESVLRYSDFKTASEIFSTGNFLKVAPITRIDDRNLEPGPFYKLARELYWDFAHRTSH
ncbi:MAG: branched-chain amino acid aminotransferase [Beijerinckiaceae bacterium]|jgi:branched-chain amino acid aminotransferase